MNTQTTSVMWPKAEYSSDLSHSSLHGKARCWIFFLFFWKAVNTGFTYWERRETEWSLPGRSLQRNAKCWTWGRWQRTPQLDQTPAWTAPILSVPGVGQTYKAKYRWKCHFSYRRYILIFIFEGWVWKLTSLQVFQTPNIQILIPPTERTLQYELSMLICTPDSTAEKSKRIMVVNSCEGKL